MQQIRKNRIIVLIIISALGGSGLYWLSKPNIFDIQEAINFVSKIISIDLFVYALFVKWFWKWKPFRNILVLDPNIQGTWIGILESSWKNEETGEKVPPIPTMLTITQDLHNVNCVMHTGEMKSRSYSGSFNIDDGKQIKQLVYTYTSNPGIHIRERSQPHDGTAVFDIIESSERKLKGRYWSERLTKGEITLEFHSHKILDEIPDSVASHPLSQKKDNENVPEKIEQSAKQEKKKKK